uniref:Uncharacterized protein n=1 Tax=Caenorhabditis japonica TaxID=281687 RepID=A0A8R1DPR5_CAEJA
MEESEDDYMRRVEGYLLRMKLKNESNETTELLDGEEITSEVVMENPFRRKRMEMIDKGVKVVEPQASQPAKPLPCKPAPKLLLPPHREKYPSTSKNEQRQSGQDREVQMKNSETQEEEDDEQSTWVESSSLRPFPTGGTTELFTPSETSEFPIMFPELRREPLVPPKPNTQNAKERARVRLPPRVVRTDSASRIMVQCRTVRSASSTRTSPIPSLLDLKTIPPEKYQTKDPQPPLREIDSAAAPSQQKPTEQPAIVEKVRNPPDIERNENRPPMPRSILVRREGDIPADQLARNNLEKSKQKELNLYELTPESVEKMTDAQQSAVLDALWDGRPSEKFKEHYPFMAEGVITRDSDVKDQLRVYSARLGKVMIPDTRKNTAHDYVYFLVLRPGQFLSYFFQTHPRNLISTKFPTAHRIVMRGYAVMAHPNERNKSESRWICWNDQMGMMQVLSGAARISLRKMPFWDKQLDVVTVHASFENNRYVVTTLCALTNDLEKKSHFPEETFLIQDAVFQDEEDSDFVFYSKSLNLCVFVKRLLAEGVDIDHNRSYQIVAAPTFPLSTRCVFRGILIIRDQSFWTSEREWIKDRLLEKTRIYEEDARINV